MDVSAYRRTYFALAKSLGLDAETRHDFNHAQTDKWSTTEFTVGDWRHCVAELQRRAGQDVAPGRPRIRGRSGRMQNAECRVQNDPFITAGQLEFLSALAERVAWKYSLVAFIRSRLLSPLRKQTWNGTLETLFRSEAGNVITVLRRMTWGEAAGTAANRDNGAAQP